MPASTCPRSGRRTGRGARRPGCPRRSGSAPATNWPWRCSTSAARLLPHAWVAGDDEMGRPVGFPPGIAGPRRALPAGGALEHAGPRPRRAAAGVLGAGPPSQEPVRAGGSLVRGAAGGGLDDDRGPRRREGAAGGRGGEASGAGADADGRDGPGGVAVRHAGAASGRHVQA